MDDTLTNRETGLHSQHFTRFLSTQKPVGYCKETCAFCFAPELKGNNFYIWNQSLLRNAMVFYSHPRKSENTLGLPWSRMIFTDPSNKIHQFNIFKNIFKNIPLILFQKVTCSGLILYFYWSCLIQSFTLIWHNSQLKEQTFLIVMSRELWSFHNLSSNQRYLWHWGEVQPVLRRDRVFYLPSAAGYRMNSNQWRRNSAIFCR